MPEGKYILPSIPERCQTGAIPDGAPLIHSLDESDWNILFPPLSIQITFEYTSPGRTGDVTLYPSRQLLRLSSVTRPIPRMTMPVAVLEHVAYPPPSSVTLA